MKTTRREFLKFLGIVPIALSMGLEPIFCRNSIQTDAQKLELQEKQSMGLISRETVHGTMEMWHGDKCISRYENCKIEFPQEIRGQEFDYVAIDDACDTLDTA